MYMGIGTYILYYPTPVSRAGLRGGQAGRPPRAPICHRRLQSSDINFLIIVFVNQIIFNNSSKYYNVRPRALESFLWVRLVGWLAVLPSALELHWLVAIRATPGR